MIQSPDRLENTAPRANRRRKTREFLSLTYIAGLSCQEWQYRRGDPAVLQNVGSAAS